MQYEVTVDCLVRARGRMSLGRGDIVEGDELGDQLQRHLDSGVIRPVNEPPVEASDDDEANGGDNKPDPDAGMLADLNAMGKGDLRAMADELGVDAAIKNKGDLVPAIMAAHKANAGDGQ